MGQLFDELDILRDNFNKIKTVERGLEASSSGSVLESGAGPAADGISKYAFWATGHTQAGFAMSGLDRVKQTVRVAPVLNEVPLRARPINVGPGKEGTWLYRQTFGRVGSLMDSTSDYIDRSIHGLEPDNLTAPLKRNPVETGVSNAVQSSKKIKKDLAAPNVDAPMSGMEAIGLTALKTGTRIGEGTVLRQEEQPPSTFPGEPSADEVIDTINDTYDVQDEPEEDPFNSSYFDQNADSGRFQSSAQTRDYLREVFDSSEGEDLNDLYSRVQKAINRQVSDKYKIQNTAYELMQKVQETGGLVNPLDAIGTYQRLVGSLKEIFPVKAGGKSTRFSDPQQNERYWTNAQIKDIERKLDAIFRPEKVLMDFVDGKTSSNIEQVKFLAKTYPNLVGEFDYTAHLSASSKKMKKTKQQLLRLGVAINSATDTRMRPVYTRTIGGASMGAMAREQQEKQGAASRIDLGNKIAASQTKKESTLLGGPSLV